MTGSSSSRGKAKSTDPEDIDEAQLAEASLRKAEAVVFVGSGDVAVLQRARDVRAARALEALPRQAAALSRALWGSGQA